jgi:hypothetical protein
LLVEVAAVTGARVSQLARLEVGDLQCDRSDPRLMMPSARKGRITSAAGQRPIQQPQTACAGFVRSRQTHSSLPIAEVLPSHNQEVVLFQHPPETDGLRLQGHCCVCIG